MSTLVKALKHDNDLVASFRQEWFEYPLFESLNHHGDHHLENVTRNKFVAQGETPAGWVDAQIQGPYAQACEFLARLPFLNELNEPFLLECAQKRVQYLCNNVLPVWHDHFPAKIVLFFHRCIAEPQSLSQEQMKTIHALAFAADLATWPAIARDDIMDGATTRNGRPARHLSHPLTFAADCNIVAEFLKVVLRTCIPDNLPTKQGLIDLFDDYNQRTTYYECFTTFLHMVPVSNRQRRCPFDVKRVTRDVVLTRNYLRAYQWIWFLFEIPRLSLCYTGISEQNLNTARESVFLASEIICYVDDLNDTPDVGQPLEAMSASDLADIMDGDVQNHLFLATLEIARDLENSSKQQDANEIWQTLQRNYGTRDADDARSVVALYRKYEIRARVKAMLRDTVETFERTKSEAVSQANMPPDILWNLATFFVKSNSGGNSSKIATAARELASNTGVSNTDKEKILMDLIYKHC